MQTAVLSSECNELVCDTYMRLMQSGMGLKNDQLLASMLASQLAGVGAMPADLGLGKSAYMQMMQQHFPGVTLPAAYAVLEPAITQRDQERDELHALLMKHRSEPGNDGLWMSAIVVQGCMGADHLWQDLGLWSRQDLSLLMQTNFASLAGKNDKDMKWKKFLYKQLCAAEGIYVCRSPSCEVCPDYQVCFGPED